MKPLPVHWDELSRDEQTGMEKMASSPVPILTVAVAERLISLGLVDQKMGRIVLNEAGRMLLLQSAVGAGII